MATFPDLCTGAHRAPHICTRTYQYKAIMSPVKGDVGQIWGTTDKALKSRMGMRILELEWKLKDVAERTGYGYKNVQRWITGGTQVPGAFVAAFAEQVPVNPRWLLTGEGRRDDVTAGTVDLGLVPAQLGIATEVLRIAVSGAGDAQKYAGMALEVLDSLGLPPLKMGEAIRRLFPDQPNAGAALNSDQREVAATRKVLHGVAGLPRDRTQSAGEKRSGKKAPGDQPPGA